MTRVREPALTRTNRLNQHHSDRLAVEHSNRFRQVADRYPRRVAEAYGGDIARTAADSDEQVAATVRAWEIAQGLSRAIGAHA